MRTLAPNGMDEHYVAYGVVYKLRFEKDGSLRIEVDINIRSPIDQIIPQELPVSDSTLYEPILEYAIIEDRNNLIKTIKCLENFEHQADDRSTDFIRDVLISCGTPAH